MQVACDSRTLNTDLEIKVLTTAMAAAQQAAQHAVTAARTSYEKVTGSPFQDIGRLDDYAADVVRALGDVDLLKSHFTGRALGEIDFDQVKAAIKTAEGGEKRRELDQAMQAIAVLAALAVYDFATAQQAQKQLQVLVDESRSEETTSETPGTNGPIGCRI